MPRLRPWERIVLTAIAAALLTWWGHNRVTWWTPVGGDIAHVVRGAASVNETLLIPPQAYRNQPLTPAQLHRSLHRALRDLGTYFTGRELRFWRQTARASLDPQNLRHGRLMWPKLLPSIDWIHLSELNILPGSRTATATLTKETRNRLGIINRVDETYHLVDTKWGWRVDRWDMHFEPGYGP
jgi:hypothetical protein